MLDKLLTKEGILAIATYIRLLSGVILLGVLVYMFVAERIGLEDTIKLILIILGTSRVGEGGAQYIAAKFHD